MLQSDEDYQTITAMPKSILQTSGKNALRVTMGTTNLKNKWKPTAIYTPTELHKQTTKTES